MRTKTLVLAAALSVAGLASSMAQSNVYSLNVVGYVNVQFKTGFTMFANPLDLDGTGLNNTVQTVFSNSLPSGSSVYPFSGGAFLPAAGYTTKAGWAGGVAGANAALKVGSGVFVSVPSDANITVVGNVLQGALSTPYIAGYNVVGSPVPQAGLVQTDLGYVPQSGASTIQYANPGGYLPAKGYTTKGGWAPAQPSIAVAEAFWLNSPAAGSWTRNFTVQ